MRSAVRASGSGLTGLPTDPAASLAASTAELPQRLMGRGELRISRRLADGSGRFLNKCTNLSSPHH